VIAMMQSITASIHHSSELTPRQLLLARALATFEQD
jgi:hypothetical protein